MKTFLPFYTFHIRAIVYLCISWSFENRSCFQSCMFCSKHNCILEKIYGKLIKPLFLIPNLPPSLVAVINSSVIGAAAMSSVAVALRGLVWNSSPLRPGGPGFLAFASSSRCFESKQYSAQSVGSGGQSAAERFGLGAGLHPSRPKCGFRHVL